MESTRLRVRNKKPGESTTVVYMDGEVEKTHLVTIQAGEDPDSCFVEVPEPVALALLQGSLYSRDVPRVKTKGGSDKGEEKPDEEKPGEDDLTLLSGVGPKIAGKLKDAGFNTFGELAEAQVNVLVQDCGLGETFAIKLVADAKEMLS